MVSFKGFLQEPVNDAPVEGDIVSRTSDITSMDLCPARVGYRDTPGYNPLPSIQMSKGSATHMVVEGLLYGVVESGSWPSVPTPADIRLNWDRLLVDESGVSLADMAPKGLIKDTVFEIYQAAHLWLQHVAPQLAEPKDIEVTKLRCVGVLPDGRALWLHGTPDLVDVDGEFHDWKTTGRAWGEGKALHGHQNKTYPWIWGRDEGDVLFTYWVYDFSQERWVPWEITSTEGMRDATMRHVWQRLNEIACGTFPAVTTQSQFGKVKRGWWCSAKYCSAWDVCTMKDIGDGVNILEPSVKGWT